MKSTPISTRALAVLLWTLAAAMAMPGVASDLVLTAPEPRRAELQPWLAELQRDLAEMLARLGGVGKPRKAVELRLEENFTEQGRRLGELSSAVVHEDRLHLVLHAEDLGGDADIVRHELARLLVRRAGWNLPPTVEDGAALWLSRRWYGRDWRDWLGDLAACDVLPDADQLLSGERLRDGSRVLWAPAAAAVVDALAGETLAAKLDPIPGSEAGRTLVHRVLGSLAASAPGVADRQSVVRSASHDGSGRSFHNGVSFAMANGLDTGYHAPAAEARLDLLRQLGVDAVSVMPFAYQRDPSRPGLAFLNQRPASETDAGVVHAARRARERGLTVLWKPHLWIGHDSWPGDIEMSTEADWQTWFRDYRRYILHHAVLAEHAGAPWFAVGVELGKTVHREDDWRRLIGAVRRVYTGRVTYAGNWWGDYEHVGFWDALDAVGIDAYFPLASDPRADLATLRTGARDAVGKMRVAAERWHRPVLLTEVGFAAREGAWVSPHEEGGTLSEADQRLAWQVLLAELGKPPWLRGLYAWKVFTHPRGEGHGKPDFRFLGRPAEQVLREYFQAPEAGRDPRAAGVSPAIQAETLVDELP